MAEYVRDTFTRTTGTGWGTAGVGGAWTESLSAGTATAATGTHGRVNLNNATGSAGVVWEKLATPSATNVAIAMAFRITAGLPSQVDLRLLARVTGAIGAPTGYGASLAIAPSGAMTLGLQRWNAGVESVMEAISWPARTLVLGQTWRLELEVSGDGTSLTSLRARLWDTALPIPEQWEGWVLVQNDTVGPHGAGATALRITRASPPASSPATFVDVDDFYMTDPPRPAFTYTVTPTTTANFTSTGTGDPVAHKWYWGDGTPAGTTAAPISHTFPAGYWTVAYDIATRWGTVWRFVDNILVAYQPVFERPMKPVVIVGERDRCDEVYSASWSLGASRWTDGLVGNTCTLMLHGRITDIFVGDPVNLALPDAASGKPLWTGTVDQITYHVDPVDLKDTTMVIAIDTASLLGRWHIHYGTNPPEHSLPARLQDLDPSTRVRYRAKWTTPAGRWVMLKAKAYKADKLRQKTYLDMVRDACTASLATAFTATNGDIVYAPWDAPAGTSGAVSIDLDGTVDCPSSVDFDRRSISGMVNRWTVGDGDPYDRVARTSIEKYGEQAWTIESGVLKSDSDFPVTDGFFEAMRQPARCPEVVVPARTPSNNVLRAQPLDIARWEGTKYAVMGVRHEVTLQGWRVTLILDRNPWATDGRTPPATTGSDRVPDLPTLPPPVM